jgi:MSHA pilin protein MshC
VTVLAVLAIVAAIAAPRAFDHNAIKARAYAVELGTAARLARGMARASGCPVRLSIDSGGYAASMPAVSGGHCGAASGGFTQSVTTADGAALQGTAPASPALVGSLQWTFNSDGSVQTSGGNAAVIGASTLSIDSSSGLVSGP